MSELTIGLLFAGATLLLMFSGTPISFALGSVAVLFMLFFMPASSLDTVTQNVYEEMASITLLSIPLFILKGAAIGKSRAGASGFVGGHDEREQTLNQLLAEMDGFDSSKGVIICAATNRPEVLDQALIRPGRFDRQVVVDKPDLRGREAILRLHARAVVLAVLQEDRDGPMEKPESLIELTLITPPRKCPNSALGLLVMTLNS